MYTYRAKVDRVVDGDTLDLVIDLGFKITTYQRIRLQGIYTPETYNVKKDSEAYLKGMAAKQFVIDRMEINHNIILIETDKDIGEYGRYLGVVYLEDSDKTLNDELVEQGLATYVDY